MRNECCGGYTTLENKEIAKAKGNAVLENAVANGAQMVITACPLCLYNLNKNATDYDVPVYYFTQILAQALGIE
jgi:heterodisulfide reductase subunit B